MADKNLGTTYIEIGVTTDKLKAGITTAKTHVEHEAHEMEVAMTGAAEKSSLSWHEFVGQRMGSYMKEFGSHGAAIKKIAEEWKVYKESGVSAVSNVSSAMTKATGGANNMNMAIGQLGYALGDSSMFMFSFRAGMMSIGNNIPVIVSGLMQAKQAAEASGSTFRSVLASSIMGPGGVLLAVNALMFALQVLPQLMGDAQSKADKFDLDTLANETDDFAKAMKELNKQVKDLSTDELDSYLSKLTTRLEETRGKLAEFTNQMSNLTLVSALVGIDLTKLFGDSKYKDFVEKLTAITKAIKTIEEEKNAPGIIGRLDADIKSLNEQLEGAKTVSEINRINASLKSLKDHRDALLGKESKKNKGSDTDIQKILKEEQSYKDELSKTNEALKQTNISEFTRNELLAKRADLLEKIHKWDRVDAARNAGLGGIEALGLKYNGKKNKDGIYVPGTTMMPIDSEKVRDQKGQMDAGNKALNKDMEESVLTAKDFANTLSSGFANAITSGENLGETFKNLAAQLAGMVIQAVLFKAIMSALDFGTGGAASGADALMGNIGKAFGFNPTMQATGGISAPAINAGYNVQSNFSLSTGGIVSGLNSLKSSMDSVKGSIQAMNVNLMSQKPIVVKNYLDGKPLAQNTAQHIKRFEQGNIQV